MDLGLRDKVALVTGGSEGIGEATAKAFAQEGAKVAICARREEPLKQVEVIAETRIASAPGGSRRDFTPDLTLGGSIRRARTVISHRLRGNRTRSRSPVLPRRAWIAKLQLGPHPDASRQSRTIPSDYVHILAITG